jgi:hypothetical protein
LSFIDLLPFSPIAGPDDSDGALSPCEANGGDAVADAAQAVESVFSAAVAGVFDDDPVWIEKSLLSHGERKAVLGSVESIFLRIPSEGYLDGHSCVNIKINIIIWLFEMPGLNGREPVAVG